MKLHPGALTALKVLGSNELQVAKMIAAGDLESPQRFMNITLYALRVTGTGASYRPSLDEFVFRRPENYLTEEFLERCAGLPVIWVHPENNLLNSEEFANRVIGGVMFAYIGGENHDEVWAIARIYEDKAIKALAEKQMSTSPSVLLGPSKKYRTQDGTVVIDEGSSRLLDHLAIVSKGVWDKDGDVLPGVKGDFVRGDSAVVDQNKEVEKIGDDGVKGDASDTETKPGGGESGLEAKLDKLLAGLEGLRNDVASCNTRMDSFESARGDAEDDEDEGDEGEDEDENENDRADADHSEALKNMGSEERAAYFRKHGRSSMAEPPVQNRRGINKRREEAMGAAKKGARADSAEDVDHAARADALEAEMRSLRGLADSQATQLKALMGKLPKQMTDDDYAALTAHQSRADDVFSMSGKRAPRPLDGETPNGYRRRVVNLLKPNSKQWKDIDIDAIRDDSAFATIETQVFADAIEAAKTPNVQGGGIVSHSKTGPHGHVVTEFYGSDTHFTALGPFSRKPQRVAGIRYSNI